MENSREIVNGKLLLRFNGKKVSITGLVNSSSPDGSSFEIQTVDGENIKINMKQPHDGPLNGYVEVRGVSQGKTVLCDEVIEWDTDDVEFDVTSHNSLCSLLNSIPNLWEYK
ncbi:PREDICTED: uncharacterized protein LOC108562439 [Nicrophorus vespilloides]|uniref:Uncharacterized protein LOC108562439 n=1 Tax=Nicrophorus vespilloides TaxID=110193 RepID=A0ABM1MNV8_NICVS|nr:PREDICTED: uncharacterized protein LOC108562439 [Nicrophorus vespilloides]